MSRDRVSRMSMVIRKFEVYGFQSIREMADWGN